jgi:hypothetical protein
VEAGIVFTYHSQTCFHFVASYAEQTYNGGSVD